MCLMKKREIVIKEIEGETVYFFETVNSTMEIAEEFIEEEKKGIIVARTQKRGRGRYGRKWVSPEGGLYFSWILEEKDGYRNFLSELVSFTLAETLEKFGIKKCGIKFPNDIMIDNKKIGGILLEKVGKYYIIGIGVNVNNEVGNIIEGAVSMKEITGREIEKEEVLKVFIRFFKKNETEFEKNLRVYLNKWSEYLIK